jgi:phosphoribosylglycinamide formyltransferase-1
MSFSFYLLSETSFHASYLVTKWTETFRDAQEFKGVIVREKQPSDDERTLRESFHQEHQGKKHLDHESKQLLQQLYPNLSETDTAMIKLFGISTHSATYHPTTIFIDDNLNSLQAKEWLMNVSAMWSNLYLFIFLDQILDFWWIELTDSKIINGHSAVLPYARGMYAIENIAITQNIEDFKKVSGATVHYIDTGIDTGPIIRVERLAEPFRFNSIWEQKGYIFSVVFELLTQIAEEMISKPYMAPIGTSLDTSLVGPAFSRKYFTLEAQKRAEEGYLAMKNNCINGCYT